MAGCDDRGFGHGHPRPAVTLVTPPCAGALFPHCERRAPATAQHLIIDILIRPRGTFSESYALIHCNSHFRIRRRPAQMSRRLSRVGAVAGFVIVLFVFPTTPSGANFSASGTGTVSISVSIPVQAQPEPVVSKPSTPVPSIGILPTPSVPVIIQPDPTPVTMPTPVVTPVPVPTAPSAPAQPSSPPPPVAPTPAPSVEPAPVITPSPVAPAPAPEQPIQQEGQSNAEVSP